MKITEILVESQQLDEGPILNKIGSAVGKAAGTVAKGVGAVAGGIAGVGSAIKKGWDAGKATVAGAGDDETDPNAPAATAKPAATGKTPPATAPGGGAGAQPAATDINAAGPKGTAPAQNLKGAAKVAADKTAAVTQDQNAAQAGQTVYAQVKANIDKLDKKGKQRILQLLQKSVAAPAAPAAPAADPGAGAMGAMAGQLAKGGAAKPNTMANAPVSKTNTAKPGNPNAATPAAEPEAPAAGGGAFKQMAQGLGKKPAAAEPVAAPAAEPAAAPSGEKTIANPVATVGTKRASNIGEPTFDTQTGKALPGQSINAIRKKAEYGTGALGAARKRIKAGAAAPAAQESIDADRRNIMGTSKPTKVREKVSESFSLFRKR